MSDLPPTQTHPQKQRQSQTRTRTAAKSAERPEALARSRAPAVLKESEIEAKRPKGLEMEEAIVTAGKQGEQNITIEMFWGEVEGHRPAGFKVATLPDHGLDVLMEQLSYRRTFAGMGSLQTGLTPVAPIGTTGRLLVTDTTTGETREQPWTWHRIGGNGLGLWQMIKRLLFK